MTNYKRGKIYELMESELKDDPGQPRKSMDQAALAELAASVRQLGVLQPIVFRLDEQGNKIVVAGARRTAAARAAGLSTIPGLFISGNYKEIAMVENLLRQDLTPIEEAEGLKAVMDEQQYSQEQLATIIGKAQNTLSEILSLNRLPQDIRDDCRADRTISKNILITIAKKEQTHAMATAYQAHKAKLKGEKATRQRKDFSDPQTVFAFLEKALGKIDTIDTSAWTDIDKRNFQTSWTTLKTKIDDYLNAPASPPPA